jgi:hypothetical protein
MHSITQILHQICNVVSGEIGLATLTWEFSVIAFSVHNGHFSFHYGKSMTNVRSEMKIVDYHLKNIVMNRKTLYGSEFSL